MRKIKNLIVSIAFQVGVDVLGFPCIVTHDLSKYIISKSKFHK
jgi:hypothetical protein